MSYYIIDAETDNIIDGSNSPVEARIKADEISRREGIETIVVKEQP